MRHPQTSRLPRHRLRYGATVARRSRELAAALIARAAWCQVEAAVTKTPLRPVAGAINEACRRDAPAPARRPRHLGWPTASAMPADRSPDYRDRPSSSQPQPRVHQHHHHGEVVVEGWPRVVVTTGNARSSPSTTGSRLREGSRRSLPPLEQAVLPTSNAQARPTVAATPRTSGLAARVAGNAPAVVATRPRSLAAAASPRARARPARHPPVTARRGTSP